MAMHRPSGALIFATWIALLLLTAGSFGLTYLPLGAFGPVVALGIAAMKVMAIAVVFMHLMSSGLAPRMIALMNALFVALLLFGIAGDVVFR